MELRERAASQFPSENRLIEVDGFACCVAKTEIGMSWVPMQIVSREPGGLIRPSQAPCERAAGVPKRMALSFTRMRPLEAESG